MARAREPRWWEIRRSQNRKPSTYRCPLCGNLLPALSEHMLLFPEGDHSRRRHAHSACVMQARRAGRLLTRDEWRRAHPDQVAPGDTPARTPLLARLSDRLRGRREHR